MAKPQEVAGLEDRPANPATSCRYAILFASKHGHPRCCKTTRATQRKRPARPVAQSCRTGERSRHRVTHVPDTTGLQSRLPGHEPVGLSETAGLVGAAVASGETRSDSPGAAPLVERLGLSEEGWHWSETSGVCSTAPRVRRRAWAVRPHVANARGCRASAAVRTSSRKQPEATLHRRNRMPVPRTMGGAFCYSSEDGASERP